MSRDEGHVIAHGQDPLHDRADEGVVVATGEVGAPDRAREEHVADDHDPALCFEEDDVPRRMPRTVPHLQLGLADKDRVFVFKPSIGREDLGRRKSILSGLLWEQVDPELILRVRPLDGSVQTPGELGCGAGVIEVRVRQEDLLDPITAPFSVLQESIDLPPWVYDGCLARLLTDEQRAVLLERRDGDDGDLHHDPSPIQW